LKPTDGDLAGVHVLLVDDTEDVLEMFGSYLRYVVPSSPWRGTGLRLWPAWPRRERT
jgi:hypothetical protein